MKLGVKGTGSTVPGKNTPDLVRVWSGVQYNIGNVQGVYREMATQVPMRFNGAPVMRLTQSQIKELYSAWTKIGDQVWAALKGRPELQETALRDRAKYIKAYNDFKNWQQKLYLAPVQPCATPALLITTDKCRYASPMEVERFLSITGRYVIGLNTSLWAIENIESEYERWMSVLPFWAKPMFRLGWVTARDVTPVVKSAVNTFVEATKQTAGFLYFLYKWGPVLAVAGVGVYAYSEFKKGGRG